MRERITLHSPVMTAPSYGSVSITKTYDLGEDRWASVETIDKKRSLFGGVNIPENATHSFIIRYEDWISSETVVKWDGNLYNILKTNDYDGRKLYLELFSRLLGEEILTVNQ